MPRFLLIALLSLLTGLASCGHKEAEPKKPDISAESAVPAGKDSLTVELVGRDSVTVLDLLVQNHRVTAKSTAAGSFVTGIDSIKSNSSLYWVYTVNGTSPDLACDKLVVHKGDRVTWHFRKF